MRRFASFATVVLVALAVGACGSSAAPSGQAPAAYRTAVCGAVTGLAGNSADFKTFYSDTSSAEDALAALDRMQARTQSAVDQLDGAGASWLPGAAMAGALASNQRELLSILSDFEQVAQTGGDQAKWTAARDRYTDWYNKSVPTLQSTVQALQGVGVTCS